MEPLLKIMANERQLAPEQQSFRARQALLFLLRKHCAMAALPEMAYTATGKPYFSRLPWLHFSLSHCRGAVMAVICDRPVGCDIEDVQADCSADLMELCFNEAEKKVIRESPDPRIQLTRLWTLKEAAVKRTGIIPDNPKEWPSNCGKSIIMNGFVCSVNSVFPG